MHHIQKLLENPDFWLYTFYFLGALCVISFFKFIGKGFTILIIAVAVVVTVFYYNPEWIGGFWSFWDTTQ